MYYKRINFVVIFTGIKLFKVKNILRLQSETKIWRGFNVDRYIADKIVRINEFFGKNNLDAAVIGLSGGVDSAVVYALLFEASKVPGSPLKKILGLSMPIYGNGTTNQNDAVKKAKELFASIKKENHDVLQFSLVDLTKSYVEYIFSNDNVGVFAKSATSFENGQLASIVRTPCLYYNAAMLQLDGYRSIVVGTTNRDEGSYIGFFGKASDAMVDLQPIADIHKSEVYEVARKLGIPTSIINAKPAGDVHDGRVDEEMIGAPYWFLEMHLLCKEFYNEKECDIYGRLDPDEKELFDRYADAIEELHDKNAHKYRVGSPARFIDVMPRAIPNGWKSTGIGEDVVLKDHTAYTYHQ